MALRVLLADESSTIKKVFQLALQDFAVEVKPVNVGIDVATVAESFKPDIIFADVLLQKKNGYDVSSEIKQNAQLKETPVVLMWSGFMDLDEDKMQASGADAQLEKPFDVKSLRALVQNLVPRTKEQKLSSYLSFPKLPEFEESSKKEISLDNDSSFSSATDKPAKDWSIDSFPLPELPEKDEFQTIDLGIESSAEMPHAYEPPSPKDDASLVSSDEGDDDFLWQQKDLRKYQVEETNDMDATESEPNINYIVPDDTFDADIIMGRRTPDQVIPISTEGPIKSGQMEDELEIELDNPHSDGAPIGLQTKSEPLKQHQVDDSTASLDQKSGKTVILNFSFEGDGGDDSNGTRSNFINPDSALKKITTQL
ncbi:MAG: response regulator, partial [Bdellovibrionales bacterium]|nr:response regulator [Bdellovibrionales bacterium]